MYISVVGARDCDERVYEIARELGREVARRGHVLVCGGLGGVMEAVSRGASEEGGLSVGILPGPDRSGASRWLTLSIPTDMGHARNALVALAGDAIIAVCGGYGTLSEIAFGLKMGKPVVGIESWALDGQGIEEHRLVPVADPGQAVALVEGLFADPGRPAPDYEVR